MPYSHAPAAPPFAIFSDENGDATSHSINQNSSDNTNSYVKTPIINEPYHSNRKRPNVSPTRLQPISSYPSDSTDSDYETESSSSNNERSASNNPAHNNNNNNRASISSLPASTLTSDTEDEQELVNTPTKPRNITSIRRSPHQHLSSTSGSSSPTRHLTPRSAGGGGSSRKRIQHNLRPSPRPRTKARQEEYDDSERLSFPLVLLHITLLPLTLDWSPLTLRKVLPGYIADDVGLLKQKAGQAVLARGVLIPHPGDEIEVLEERLLECLDLEQAGGAGARCLRYCKGRSRESGDDGDERVDSALGDVLDEERCETCGHDVNAAAAGEKRWEVKIYAANGLMRASAWAAAWSEMERVDVEILPWIPESMRKELDECQDQEDAEARERAIEERAASETKNREEAAAHVEELQHRRIWELEQRLRLEEQMRNMQAASTLNATRVAPANSLPMQRSKSSTNDGGGRPLPPPSDTTIPQAYRPKEVPLDVLVRNYIYLLAQDRRNMVILFLGILALFSLLRSPVSSSELQSGQSVCQASYNVSGVQPLLLSPLAANVNASFDAVGLVNDTETGTAVTGIPFISVETTGVKIEQPETMVVPEELVEETGVSKGETVDVEANLQDLDDMMQ